MADIVKKVFEVFGKIYELAEQAKSNKSNCKKAAIRCKGVENIIKNCLKEYDRYGGINKTQRGGFDLLLDHVRQCKKLFFYFRTNINSKITIYKQHVQVVYVFLFVCTSAIVDIYIASLLYMVIYLYIYYYILVVYVRRVCSTCIAKIFIIYSKWIQPVAKNNPRKSNLIFFWIVFVMLIPC